MALVLPNLNPQQTKQLESLVFKFMWDNKTDKVARDHAKLKEKAGGLGAPDMSAFWLSLKFSWFRRALATNAFWPKILLQEVRELVNVRITTICDVMTFGPNALNNIGKSMSNQFWKQIFISVTQFMQGAIFCNPEKILVAPLWDNPLFQRNNRALKRSDFPLISHTINCMADFFHPNTNKPKTRDEVESTMNCNLDLDTFTDLKYVMKLSLRSLGLSETFSLPTFLPFRPLLIDMANASRTGCNQYSRFLRKHINMNSSLFMREEKWHRELNLNFSQSFWNSAYTLTSEIKFDNKMKWLQYQINRNSLFTNYKVSKFNNDVLPFCTFCMQLDPQNPDIELISHLFFRCPSVNKLWTEVSEWLSSLGVIIPLDIRSLLFGILDQPSLSVPNSVILYTKYYIWCIKQSNGKLNLAGFQKQLKYKLQGLRNAYLLLDNVENFNPWLTIFNFLSDQ